jgi:hypothetical protein
VLICPGCQGPKSRRAQLCAGCRRRAVATGARKVLEPDPPGEPRSPAQNGAFHGKCGTLAQLELGAGATPAQVSVFAVRLKREALDWAGDRYGRQLTSSTELSRDEMSEVLDWLDARIALAQP